MRIKAISLLLFILFSLPVYPQGKVYDFRLKDTENKTVSLSEISGKSLTVIDFWATWCQPCIRSMGIRYPILLDSNGELMGELNVTAVPTLFIIDGDYRILYMHEGFNAGDEITIQEEIDKHLGSNGH